MREKDGALMGQGDGPSIAHEQYGAQLALQFADAVANGAGGQQEVDRSLLERLGAGSRLEQA